MRVTWRMSSLWTARASSVHVRVRAISSRSRAEGDTPAAAALLLPGGVLRRRDVGGDHYGAAIRHGHTGTGFGGRCPRPPAAPAAAREAGGSKGGTRPPSPVARCSTLRGLAPAPLGVLDSPPASASDGLGGGNLGSASLHTAHEEARPQRCQQPESMRFPKGSSAVPDADQPPPVVPPSHPEELGISPHTGRLHVT